MYNIRSIYHLSIYHLSINQSVCVSVYLSIYPFYGIVSLQCSYSEALPTQAKRKIFSRL